MVVEASSPLSKHPSVTQSVKEFNYTQHFSTRSTPLYQLKTGVWSAASSKTPPVTALKSLLATEVQLLIVNA